VLNLAPRHEDELGSGGIAPQILNVALIPIYFTVYIIVSYLRNITFKTVVL